MDKIINIDLFQNIVKCEQNKLKKCIFNKISKILNKTISASSSKNNILIYAPKTCYYNNKLINLFEQNKIENESKDIIISMLAKINFEEYNRILKNNGKIFIVCENKRENFKEIFDYFGIKISNKIKDNNLNENLFKILKRKEIKEQIELNNELIQEIVPIISKHKNINKKKIDELQNISNFKITLNYIIVEAVKKEFFFNNLEQKPADRAGCIIISKKNPRNLALSYDQNDKTLFFPKGHIDEGETKEETALREVLEETGINVELINKLDDFECISIYNNEKHRVTFFIANSLDDELDNERKIEKHLITVWIDYKELLNLDFPNPSYKEFYIKNFKKIEKYVNKQLKNNSKNI